ncbi:DUF885 domain-containing protein [Aquincola sp. S2]|uniref:DUF885 domain-containing protein n=1 Tax=Pseudaquabacterium terrae TaxID=2732868 RepID=A0ABX2EC72_9BURK|nr:DUF885 domain-containing protein [Aquabacterium terrae]NRF65967.1 DUF885 domain-containing protein [Aquabacterium terrae]
MSITRLLAKAAIAVAWLLAAATPLTAAEPPPDRALAALFERTHQWQLQDDPESATFVGDTRYNDRLTERTPAAVARRKAQAAAVLAALQRFDARRLNTQDRISRALMIEQLQLDAQIDALYGALPFAGLGGWQVVGPQHGPQHELPALAKASPFRDARDYEHYLKRLAQVPGALDEQIAMLRAGMRSGWLPAAEAMAAVPAQFDPFTGPDIDANPLYAPFKSFPPAIAAPERARLEAAARSVLGQRVRPAFVALRRFLEAEYLPACRATLAASQLPGGMAYYELAVRQHTTTTQSARQVHETGLTEVARIAAEMDALIRRLGGSGPRADFIAALRADPRFRFSRGDEMLKAYRDIAKRVDAELPKLFAELPRLPYGIRGMEANAGDAAEHYTPGALDGSRAGFFEANVTSLATRPSFDLENTLLHEAVPGHHLQIARAQEIRGLPAFRRNGWYVAYGEGWALYAESLGPALGLYQDPHSRLGAYASEMLRACRLVVDTGLHAFGWTRAQAIRYLVDHTGYHVDYVASEVDRYLLQPGQALGYKLGELKIKALRAQAEAALGARFDLRRFHNALLDDGALPLTLLQSRIEEWIAGEQRAAGRTALAGQTVRRGGSATARGPGR